MNRFCSRVSFPDTVKWISLEFDIACSLAQPEDSLQIFVPKIDSPNSIHLGGNINMDDNFQNSMPLWPVLQKYTSRYGLNILVFNLITGLL